MPSTYSDNDVLFESSALEPGRLLVRRMEARMALSRPYVVRLVLQSRGEALFPEELEAMLAGTAAIGFGVGREHPVHGVLSDIEMVSMAAPSPVQYRATLVPRLWYAARTFRSRVFQELAVPEIVKRVLLDTGLEDGRDFEILADAAAYPKREYTVQHQETDLDFVCRLMEHEGIFFFFEQDEDGDRLVVADDSKRSFAELPGHEEIGYAPVGGTTDPRESVTALGHRLQALPAEVVLCDYNYRTPRVSLAAGAPVDAAGHGTHVYYGEHFKTPDEGKRLARIRAEELAARRQLHAGASSVRGLRPGVKFRLAGHFLGGLDQDYAVTEVSHSVVQDPLDTGGAGAPQGYRNEFVAIPLATAFRPERVTRRPRIHGLMHGIVDGAAGGGTAAPIDDLGRYKILLPMDSAGQAGGRASRWIRMAQPSSGAAHGIHFPLHIGTEVVVAHVDGDPDRPIIVASVPNAETASPVHAGNATQSLIRSRAGVHIRFDDDAP